MLAPIVIEPTVVRDLHDDEKLVLDDFERHAGHCTQCALALENHDNIYCERGHLLAVDVTKYLYSESGKHFAVVDKENGKPMRVKLPREANAVRNLLDSIEGGLHLQSPRRGRAPPVRPPSSRLNRPIVEHVRPRSRTPDSETIPHEIIERSPASSKRHVIVYHSPRHSPRVSPARSSSSRGSLYIPDHLDREERRYESSRIYRGYHR